VAKASIASQFVYLRVVPNRRDGHARAAAHCEDDFDVLV
jgi:hypothetical protein